MVKRNQDAAASIYGDPMWRWRRVFRPLSLWERVRVREKEQPPGLRIDGRFIGRQSRKINKHKVKCMYLGSEGEGWIADCNIFVDTVEGLNYSPAILWKYCGAHVL